jgi:hypothetical protein
MEDLNSIHLDENNRVVFDVKEWTNESN